MRIALSFLFILVTLPGFIASQDVRWDYAWAVGASFDARQPPERWQPLEDPSQGYSSDTLWLRLTISGFAPDSELLLVEDYGLDYIDLYRLEAGGIRLVQESGWGRGYEGLTYFHGKNHFVLENPNAEDSLQFFLAIRTSTAFYLDFSVQTPDGFLRNITANWILIAALLGYALGTLVYHLVLAIMMKNRLYGYYAALLFFTIIVLGWNLGVAHLLFWPYAPLLGNFLGPVGIIAGLGLLLLLVHQLLEANARQRGIWRYFPGAARVLFLLSVLFFLVPPSLRSMLGLLVAMLVSIVMAVLTGLYSIRNRGSIRYASLGITLLMIGAVLYVLRTFGVVPDNLFTQRALDFGWTAEMMLFSFAIGNHFNGLRIDLQRSQTQLEEFNHRLEETVRERTSQLEDRNTELRSRMEQLSAAQEKTVNSEKLASLGRTVAGVAHEINTPLGNSVTLLSYLQELIGPRAVRTIPPEDCAQISDVVEMLTENIERSVELVKSFKLIAGSEHKQDPWSNAAEFFEHYQAIDRHELEKQGIHAEWRYSRDTEIPMDSESLILILDALLDNVVVHAYPPSWPENRDMPLRISVSSGRRYCRISVRDWGVGIGEDHSQKVFEPFYTVRRIPGHPGLGLHSVYNIVSLQHGGELRLFSPPSGGTVFHLLLPLRDAEA
jgi:signal transduction histidine kinase